MSKDNKPNESTEVGKKKSKKGYLMMVAIVLVVIAFYSCGESQDDETDADNDVAVTETETAETDSDYNKKVVKKLVKNCDISEELAIDIYQKSVAVGIPDDIIKNIKPGEDGWDFTVAYEKTNIYYGASDSEVLKISCGESDTMIYGADGVLGQISDYLLTEDEYYWILTFTEQYVEDLLKSPSTAEWGEDYKGEWEIEKNGEEVTVVTFVDSENGFGAMVRSNIDARYKFAGGEETPEVIDLSINGESYIEDGEIVK